MSNPPAGTSAGSPPPESPGQAPSSAAASPDPPDVSLDDRDVGWGQSHVDDGDRDEWYRRERPPHHG